MIVKALRGMHRLFAILAVALAASMTSLGGPSIAKACTTILVGKALTADGSVIHAHNEDMGNEAVGRLWAVEPSRSTPGDTLSVPYVELPRVDTFGYWASGNVQGAAGLGTADEVLPYDSVLVGLNSNGVSMSCNWAYSREENRQEEGIRRYAIRQLLLERATSARHGVEILGSLIEEHGQADWGGLVYHLADTREAWVVETTTRNWVARRVRDDEIHVTANRFRIGSDYDLSSSTLVSHAVAAGWLESADGELDFNRVYGQPEKMEQAYDVRREVRAAELLRGKARAITPEDLFDVLRDRYEGTGLYTPPRAKPVWREDVEKNPALHRSISTNLLQSTFVAHLRGELPVGVGAVMWFGLATSSYAGYLPLYAGGGSVPAEYSHSLLEESDDSAWWLFRRLQRAADGDYLRAYPSILNFWSSRHALATGRQRQIEARALGLLEEGRESEAAGLLSAFTFSQADQTLYHARRQLQLLSSRTPMVSNNAQVQGRGEGKDQWWDALPRAAWSGFPRIAQSQPWFEVYEIRPGVLAIYEPGQFEEVISYLILGSERALLFDTGLGIGDMRRLAGELTEREVVVLNSHTHYDHVGGNHAFENVYGTDLEYTRKHTAGRPHEEVAEFVGEGWIWMETPEGFSTESYRSRPFTITEKVGDGQVISLGDVDLEVLLTPGHAPDSLCLLDRQRRLLFTGDTFYPATLYAHLPGSTFADYERTAGRLASLAGAVDVVLPAHNEPTLPAGELVAFRDAFRAMREESVPFVLTDGNREYDFGRFSVLVSDPPPWVAADLVITHGRVYTFTWGEPSPDGTPAPDAPRGEGGWRPDAEAVAVRGGEIVFVGSAEAARAFVGPDTEVLDAGGATVLPGLVDSHTHVAGLGELAARVNLIGVETEEEAVARVVERAASTPEGEWILGRGWDEGAWANRYPTLDLLSEKVPRHPVVLESLHGFAVWGNRLAFERAGIDEGTASPEGGEILRDADGNPSGVVLNRAGPLLTSAVPEASPEQFRGFMLAGLQQMARDGYVAVHEAGSSRRHMRALESLSAAGELPIRVYAMLSARDGDLCREWLEKGPVPGTEGKLAVRSVKAYYDAALGSRGARLLADYSDLPGHRGTSGDEYGFDQGLVTEMMKGGFQVGIHAIGDAGNRETLEFLESVVAADPESRRQRHRIEHAQVLHPDDFARLAPIGVIASMEPPHAVEDMTWAEERLGPDRIRGAYAWRTLRQAGARLTFNSDLSGSDHGIFYGLHAAITRRDKQRQPPDGWYPEETMTPEEAVRGYTVWSAWAAHWENETGVLAPGRWADLTVMDVDPLVLGETDPGAILDGKIVATIVAGRVVYRAAGE